MTGPEDNVDLGSTSDRILKMVQNKHISTNSSLINNKVLDENGFYEFYYKLAQFSLTRQVVGAKFNPLVSTRLVTDSILGSFW